VSPTPTLVVNGRFLTHVPTGVQRFAREVTRELATLVPLVVVAPRGPLVDPEIGAEIVQVGRTRGHLWEQVDLPAHLRRLGRPLLLGLANTGPVTYRPQIATHHDVVYVRYPAGFARRFRALYAAAIPRLLRASSRVLTVSAFSADELAQVYRIDPGKITVVPNAVASDFCADGDAYDIGEPYFLAVSSPALHKNFDELLAAFAAADTTRTRRLLIVGDSARPFSGRSSASATGVEFLGRVDEPTLHRLYRGAEAFLFPSLYEGFGIPPLEAQRMGTPVVAVRRAAMPDVLRDSVLWADSPDAAGLARAIRRLDADPELRAELARRGIANERRYSWGESAAIVASVVDEVRGGGHT